MAVTTAERAPGRVESVEPERYVSGRREAARSAAHAYLLLLLAAALMPFANGTRAVAAAAWVGPALLLAFTRARRSRSGLAAAYVVFLAAWCVQWRGVIRLPPAAFLAAAVVMSLIGFLPYVADRLLVVRLGGVTRTLVFPLALVSMELAFSLLGPNGSWGSVGYTQYSILPLVQLASLTGLWGLSFLVGWGASTAAHVWGRGRAGAATARAGLVFLSVLAAVLLYGGARLLIPHDGVPTWRVASVSAQYDDNLNYDPALAAEIQEYLYERSAREAQAGARLILWPEDSFAVYRDEEEATVERARRFAREHGVYLGVGYNARVARDSERYENRLLLAAPTGEVAWNYVKTNAVPGREERLMVRGGGRLPTFDAGEARLAGAICYDGDYASLIRQAGRASADLLILPADDWREITPLHARMSVFRAVEQGASLVRPTMNGLSLATDYRGRLLAEMDHYATTDRVMVANVPLSGARTIYTQVGDLFAWACLAGLVALFVLSKVRRP